jgi:hypothetical protein
MTSTLNFNVVTAPEKAIAGERPRRWGPSMADVRRGLIWRV